MSTTSPDSSALSPSSVSTLAGVAPVALSVFLGSLAISVPLGALAVELGSRQGFSALTTGAVIGLQSIATLLTRHRSGTLADHHGPHRAILLGLPISAASGLAYLLSALMPLGSLAALAMIVLGRLAMGLGESLFMTGLMSLGIARLGPARTGRVMSWVGIAIYAALGLGAPLGVALQARQGFAAVGLVACVAPLLALLLILRVPRVRGSGGNNQRVPFHRVIGLIWRPGLVLTLSMVPFAAMAAFLPLIYAARGWPLAGVALFGFAAAYILVRLVAPGLPDRFGAAPVAVGSLLFELAGQGVLWLAPSPGVAVIGAVLTGLGFSLVFPAMGVLATRSVPPEQRGRAVGNFMSFADVSLGLTGPAVGLASHWAGPSAAFVVGALATTVALLLLPGIRARAKG